MKHKIAIASAFLAASSFSMGEIEINEFLSFEGFVDSSYTHTDVDDDSGNFGDMSDNNFQVDEVEISWLFNFDPVTAQVDTQYTGIGSSRNIVIDNAGNPVLGNSGEAELDQAFVTYHMDDGGAITAGRYDSMLGFEAFESPGLYQYSLAYDFPGLGDLGILPVTNQGVKYTYEAADSMFGISLQDAAFNSNIGSVNRLGGSGDSSWALEAAGSMQVTEELGFFLGGVYEDAESSNLSGTNFDDTWAINAYTTFETGSWLFAAELNYAESDGASQLPMGQFGAVDEEAFNALLMANFAYSPEASVTGRLSYADHDADDSAGNSRDAEYIKYTLAHNYAFTDNLALVTEVSYADGDDYIDADALEGAVELIFTF